MLLAVAAGLAVLVLMGLAVQEAMVGREHRPVLQVLA
jgi:hypothetical protein